jgi:2'-5' RNA ligase
MENKFICVMAGYDDKTEISLVNIQKKLYERGYVGEHTKDLPQHITLGTFKVSQEIRIKELIKKVSEKTKSFPITFNHVGIFGGSKVLFIAPDPNRKLLKLKENFGDSYGWTPHTTMLIDKPDIIYQTLPIVADNFEAFEGFIKYIYLYEFWPTRFICSEKLI